MDRRGFLKSVVSFAAVSAPPPRTYAQGGESLYRGSALETMFDGLKLTDQEGKPFDAKDVLGKKQCIMLFGYNGCPLCEHITKVVAATQKKLLAAQITDVPVVIMSVQPEEDRTRRAEYVQSYGQAGVKEFADPAIPAAKRTQENRLLHILCPASATQAQVIQRRLVEASGLRSGLDPTNSKQHTRNLYLFDRGVLMVPQRGTKIVPFIGATLNADEDFEATPILISEQSDRLLRAVKNVQMQKSR